MLKCILLICLTAFGPIIVKAEQTAKPDTLNNPFSAIDFLNQPTETLTLTASDVNGVSDLNEYNLSVLESITKLYGLNLKKFHYSIAFKLDGYPQIFDVPCCDENLYHLLSARANPVSRLKLKCVVYRFYTIDGTTNFFYIEKATPAGTLNAD
jgi:hypothetical protein